VKTVAIVIFSMTILGYGAWYLRFIYAYERWFDTHLVATIWTAAKEKEVTEILNQPFLYCGQGSTSKAYVSTDGQFVIKCFLQSEFISKKSWSIPVIKKLANRRKELRVKYNRIFGPIYAYQNIPKESGLIYYQFIRPSNHFHQQVQLIEKDGSTVWLDLNQTEFLIQKKAVLVSDYLRAHVIQGDLEGAKSGLAKLLWMAKNLYDQGIVLVTLQFLDNFGFVGDDPMRIDVEHISFDANWKETGKAHMSQELAKFRSWIVEHTPQLILFFNEIEKKILE
jgi:hypothetical protein